MNGTTTYGAISQRTAAYAAAKMLEHAEPVLVLQKFADHKQIPKNKADTIKFRRPIPFVVGTNPAPVVEGVNPVAKVIQYEDVTATLKQYAGVVEITDKVNDLSEDPVLNDALELNGEEAGEVTEMVTYGAIKGGTNVVYANGTSRTDVNTAVSLNDIRLAVRTISGNRGKKITKILDGSPKYDTHPIEAAYVAVGHTDLAADIRNLAGFTPVSKYGNRKPLCPEEIGSVEDVRFVLSPLLVSMPDAGGDKGATVSTSGVKSDVYPLAVFGAKAFGVTPLKGAKAVKPMVVNPDTPSGADPTGQRGYVSWKTWFAALILNESWLCRIECAASDLA